MAPQACHDCIHEEALGFATQERDRARRKLKEALRQQAEQHNELAELETENGELKRKLGEAVEARKEMAGKLRESEGKSESLQKMLKEAKRKARERKAIRDKRVEQLERQVEELRALSSRYPRANAAATDTSPGSSLGQADHSPVTSTSETIIQPNHDNAPLTDVIMTSESPAGLSGTVSLPSDHHQESSTTILAQPPKDLVVTHSQIPSSPQPSRAAYPLQTEVSIHEVESLIPPIATLEESSSTYQTKIISDGLSDDFPPISSATPAHHSDVNHTEISGTDPTLRPPEPYPSEIQPKALSDLHSELPPTPMSPPPVMNDSNSIKPSTVEPRRGSRLEVTVCTRIVGFEKPSSALSASALSNGLQYKTGRPAYKQTKSLDRPRTLSQYQVGQSRILQDVSSKNSRLWTKSGAQSKSSLSSSPTPVSTDFGITHEDVPRPSKRFCPMPDDKPKTIAPHAGTLADLVTLTAQANDELTSTYQEKRKQHSPGHPLSPGPSLSPDPPMSPDPPISACMHKKNRAYVLLSRPDPSWEVFDISRLPQLRGDVIDLTLSDEESEGDQMSVDVPFEEPQLEWSEEERHTDSTRATSIESAKDKHSAQVFSLFADQEPDLSDLSELTDTDTDNTESEDESASESTSESAGANEREVNDADVDVEADVSVSVDNPGVNDTTHAADSSISEVSGSIRKTDDDDDSGTQDVDIELQRPLSSNSWRAKGEVKDENIGRNTIDEDSKRRRLDGLTSFPVQIKERISSVGVSRAFLSSKFGGSPQSFYPNIDRSVHDHGYHFLFPALQNNPDAPRKPGDVGLLYRTVNSYPWGGRAVKLFVKFKANDYRYMGDYQTAPTDPLGDDEYRRLPMETKRAWARLIRNRKIERKIRARITLRKNLAREPSEEEVETFMAQKSGGQPSPGIQDIVDAYSRGDEKFYIFQLKCVGYDEAFQRELAGAVFVTIPRSRTPESIPSVSSFKHHTSAAGRRSNSGCGSDYETFFPFLYRPRGTKTRPARFAA